MLLGAHLRFQRAVMILTNNHDPKKGQVATIFTQIWHSGSQPNRFFHTTSHYFNVAGSTKIRSPLDAVRFFAGMTHDVVSCADQKNGITTQIHAELAPYFLKKGEGFFIRNVSDAKQDPLFAAALDIFGLAAGERLSPTAGQNEFLSGIYALKKGRELGIPDRYLVAILAHIESTIAFGAPDRFQILEKRLRATNQRLSVPLTEEEIVSTLRSAMHMANRDVRDFKRDFSAFINGTRLLLRENAKNHATTLDTPEHLFKECMNMALFLENIRTASQQRSRCIFHISPYATILERDAILAAEATGQEIILRASEYLRANAAAAALVGAIAVHQKSNNSLSLILDHALLLQLPQAQTALSCSPEVLAETSKNILTTDQVAGYLLTHLGTEGVEKLSALANNINSASEKSHEGLGNPSSASAFLCQAQELFQKTHSSVLPALIDTLSYEIQLPLAHSARLNSLRRSIVQNQHNPPRRRP